MSEIKDRVKEELRAAGFGEGQINYVLGMREIAVVDRDAQTPNTDSRNKFMRAGYSEGVGTMLIEGWVKEVK